MMRLIVLMGSLLTLNSYAKDLGLALGKDTTKLLPPKIELFCDKDTLAAKTIRGMELWSMKVILLEVRSEFPPELKLNHLLKEAVINIDSLELIFVEDNTVPLLRIRKPGPFVTFPFYWPGDFDLKKGSWILFKFYYSYRRKDEMIISSGEVIKKIIF